MILVRGETSHPGLFGATPKKIPFNLKPLIAMPDFPEKLGNILEKAVT